MGRGFGRFNNAVNVMLCRGGDKNALSAEMGDRRFAVIDAEDGVKVGPEGHTVTIHQPGLAEKVTETARALTKMHYLGVNSNCEGVRLALQSLVTAAANNGFVVVVEQGVVTVHEKRIEGLTMTSKAGGNTYEAFRAAGWTDAQLIEHEYAKVGT